MMRIRKRPRYDKLRTEVRARKVSISRWIYLAMVAGFGVWLFDMFFGSYFYFDAMGIVTRDRFVVAVSHVGTVTDVFVKEGDHVSKGQVVAAVDAPLTLEGIANLNAKIADFRIRQAQLQARSEVLDAINPLAASRASKFKRMRQGQEKMYRARLGSQERLSESLDDEYDSVLEHRRLVAEREAIRTELALLDESVQKVSEALRHLEDSYSMGAVTSVADGIVTSVLVAPGSAVSSGDSLMEIFSGRPYVLAYATPGGLVRLDAGDSVDIAYGVNRVPGRVSKVLPMSASLPIEFQRSFRPRDRAQVLRIDLNPEFESPPLFTKVELSHLEILPRWSVDPVKNNIRRWQSAFATILSWSRDDAGFSVAGGRDAPVSPVSDSIPADERRDDPDPMHD